MKRRGFSLLELILCLALLGILIVSLAYNLRKPAYKSQSQGAAEVVAQELRTAQQTAVTSRQPVAICFPSNAGSQPCAQSYYTLQGFEQPQVVRSRRFHGEFPQARVFNGYWALDPSQLLNAGSGLTAANPRLGSVYDNQDFSNWNTAFPQDFSLIFMPDGSVRSNGLPMFDGCYHIVVCNEVAFTGAASPSGAPPSGVSYYTPTRVASPYTITIGALGTVQVEQGLTAMNAGAVAMLEGGSEFQGSAPPAPGQDTSTPAVAGLEMLPVPLNVPSGASAVVDANGYLTLVSYATDAQGGPLYCSWTCNGGQFSGNQTMEYVPSLNRWRAAVAWAPPVPAGGPYTLGVRVEDPAGHSDTATLGSTGKAALAESGSIVYSSDRGGDSEICVVRPDGSRSERFLHTDDATGADDTNPVLSPDGSKIAFTSDRTGDTEVFVMMADGTGLTNISNDPGEDIGPITWSPDGTRVCWASDRIPNTYNLYCARCDGTQLVQLTNELGANECKTPTWSPDGTKIAYEMLDFDFSFNGQIYCIGLDTSGGTITATTRTLVSNNNDPDVWANADGPPTWNEASTSVAWSDDRDWMADWDMNTGMCVYKGRVDGSGVTRLTFTNGTKDCGTPVWSPNGNKICYQVLDWDTFQTDIYTMNPDGSNKNRVTNDPYLDTVFASTNCYAMGSPVAWSPNSQEVCFLSYAGTSTDVYRIRTNGSGLLQLTAHEEDDLAGPEDLCFSWSNR